MSFTRRTFLAGSAMLLASRWVRAKSARTWLLIGGLKYQTLDEERTSHMLVAIDESGKRYAQIPLDFYFHGFAPHPNDRRRAVIFEKQGPGACEVDLADRKVRRPVKTSEDRWFYGHGAFSPDGKQVYATETIRKTGEGVIAIRDGTTLEPVGEFPSYGQKPHDCILFDAGRTLAVTNAGSPFADAAASPACVTFVDVATRKLREKLSFSTPRINAGHLALTAKKHLVVVSAPRAGLPDSEMGAISARSPGGALRTFEHEVRKKMIGETLSLAIDEPSGTVGVTNPYGDVLTFWNFKTGKFLKSFSLVRPRAIALSRDRRFFVVAHGNDPELGYFSTDKLALDDSRTLKQARISSSHMYTWEI
jgi:hypothetical protein